jgi:hypothetical protein
MREELDTMAIVARWLVERDSADGRVLRIDGPGLNPAALLALLPAGSSP